MEQDSYSNYFKKGTIVEVSSEDEGLRGSWYTATVIRPFSPKTQKILVEYHNLMADDAGSKPLRELVPAVLLRPIPPREPHRLFSLMEDVDAYHNDGWWEGVVTNITPLTNTSSSSSSSFLYSVFFRCSREQIDFFPSDLRLHREWLPIPNLWVPPFDNPNPGQRSGEGGRNGYHSSGENDKMITRSGGRRTGCTPMKQDGVVKNARRNDEMSGEKLRISSNGVSKKHGLTNNGKLKGRRASK